MPGRRGRTSPRIATWVLLCGLAAASGAAAAPSTTSGGTAWPQRFTKDDDTLLVYQPQMKSWQDRLRLDARVPVVVLRKGSAAAAGALDVLAHTDTDPAKGSVVLTDVDITAAHFPDAAADQEVEAIARELLPPSGLALSLDYVLAALALSADKLPAVALDHTPPKIFVAEQPSRLVVFEGTPVFAAIERSALKYALNTNWPVFQAADSGYFLLDTSGWLNTDELESGTWTYTSQLPPEFDKLPNTAQWADVHARMPAAPSDALPPLDFFVATGPAELIVVVGEVAWKKIDQTHLFYASNTESLLFWEGADKDYYYLVAGRWFRSKSLDGPWQYASRDLPADFAALPADGALAAVRAAVPGTVEAREAAFAATIPHLAVVDRQKATATVTYAGEPSFAPIQGTSLSYAVNSPDDVIRVGDTYYLCENGVWFTAAAPAGPWAVADSVPADIYAIPPSSSVYNTTYVRLYESDATSAVFGYSGGYQGTYVDDGVLVWGSGYYYPAYVESGAVPSFFPRAYTYGCDAFYDPTRGAFLRAGYGYGPRGGIGAAAVYNPYTGTYSRAVVAHGPDQSVAIGQAVNPRTGLDVRGVRRADPYAAWQEAVVPHGSRLVVPRYEGAGEWPAAARGPADEMYAAADGRLYRRAGDRWEPYAPARRELAAAPREAEAARAVPREAEVVTSAPRQAEVVTSRPREMQARDDGGATAGFAAQRQAEEQRVREMEGERMARERAAANAQRMRSWGGGGYRDMGGGRFASRGRR